MENKHKVTIGAIVATDYRAADVFRKYSIDFCCNGNRSIEEACKEGNIDAKLIENDLQALTLSEGSQKSAIDFRSWPLDLLADYIEKKHHRYVAMQIPVIKAYLLKIVSVHGDRHPELQEIMELFDASAEELTAHMKKEETVLFPVIRKMVEAKQDNLSCVEASFDTVDNPIRVMMQEHDTEGTRFRKIAALTNNYQVPEDGCNTYLVTYKLLKEFEEDLHLHIHLENNILFPGAIESW